VSTWAAELTTPRGGRGYSGGMNRIIGIAVLLVSTVAAAEPLQKAEGYRGIWYSNTDTKDEYRFKYSGGMATYPQQHEPIAIYRPEVNKTFFVFGGTSDPTNKRPELVHMVGYYDHAAGTFARPRILLNKHTSDAHDNATLAIDERGFLFVFCNAHGTGRPSYIYRGKEPYSIDDFERVWEGNFSYGQPWYVKGQGFLLLHTHYEAAAAHHLFTMSSEDGVKWSERRGLSHIPKGQYQISWQDPREPSRIVTVFDFHPNGLDSRTNMYFLETRDLGRTWKTVEGKEVQTPLTEPHNAALVHDYQAEKLNVYLKDVQFDAQGRPIILYLTSKGPKPGPANAPYQWRTCRWTGSAWEIRPFTTSDHNYDHGSLYVLGSGQWRVIAPTEPGPQPYGTGGEMVVWSSKDQGATWEKVRQLTHDSPRNHTYLRRPLNFSDDFAGIWADGNAREASESFLYFTNVAGEGVWRLPQRIDGDYGKAELVR